MIRKLFWVVVIAGVGAAVYFGTHEYERRRLLDALNQTLSIPDPAPRRVLALALAKSALAGLEKPNVYAFISPESIRLLQAKLGDLTQTMPSVGEIRSLTLKARSIELEDAAIAIAIEFEGTLRQAPVTVTGMATILAAPAFDGSDLNLYPLDARIAIDGVTFGDRSDRTVLPTLMSAVAGPLVDYLASRVGSIAIPLELGLAREFDLAKSLADVVEVKSIEQGATNVYMAFKSSAVLATAGGLHLIASAQLVSQAELDAAMDDLRSMRKQVGALPPAVSCASCQFTWPQVDGYAVCLRKQLDCQTDLGLGVHADAGRLSPVQALALRKLAQNSDTESQEIAKALRPFLVPSLKSVNTPSNADSLDKQLQDLRDQFLALRNSVEPPESFTNGDSVVAVRKDVVSSSLNQVASLLSPKASFAFDQRQENFNQTISSPPPSNLNCSKNLRACPSDFDADYARDHVYNPRGCDSGCTVRKCDSGDVGKFFNGGREICYDTVDLACVARKASCELTKEGERLKFESDKLAAKADWSLKKLDCERLKETEKTGCEINQAWLNLVGDKELGRIEGNAVISAANSSVAFRSLNVSPGLEEVNISMAVQGAADVNASFIFSPLNAGYVACVAQWGGSVKATVTLPPTEIALKATLDTQASTAGSVVYRLAAIETAIKMSPAPGVALLSQNPHMALVCPAVGAVASAAPLTVAIVLPLLDTIPVKIPPREIRLPLLSDLSIDWLGGGKPTVAVGTQSLLLRVTK